MGVAVHACGRHDVQASCLGDPEQAFGVTTKADRCPVDKRLDAGCDQCSRLFDGTSDIRELVTRLDGCNQEEVLMRVGGP